MNIVFSMLHKLIILLYRCHLFDIYKISDLEYCVHYWIKLGIPWKVVLKELECIYEKMDDYTGENFEDVLTSTQRRIYNADVPRSVYMQSRIRSLSVFRHNNRRAVSGGFYDEKRSLRPD